MRDVYLKDDVEQDRTVWEKETEVYIAIAGKSVRNRIILVGGDSGTGKTVLYEMLEDVRLTEQYNAIKLFNYKSENMKENLKKCRDCFIVIDNADILIDDDIRRFINFEFSNQYMLFSRNCDGLNVSDKSFKILQLDDNKITLQDEL